MFSPITELPQFRRFLTYDMEWAKEPCEGDEKRRNYRLRLINIYDGKQHRAYYSIQAFLRGELIAANRGKWFFAHAGGLADIQFVLEGLLETRDYGARICTSGSSAIIVEIKKGKQVWCFVDSLWLMKDKLANIGKWIGLYKTGPHEGMSQEEITHWYNTVPMSVLQPYCEQDCLILWEAINAFETLLIELGGELQRTIGSSAMRLFRRKYQRRTIETSKNANEKLKGSYFASRVEVLRKRGGGKYYDINSSFPFAMTQVQPGEWMQSYNHLPTRLADGEGTPYFIHATIEIPEMYLPPMPVRTNGKIYFPTGVWTSWLSWIDLELILSRGGRLIQVFECLEYDQWWDLAEYANNIYERRRKSEGFIRLGLKFLLNSLYGKFAEQEIKQVIHLRPSFAVMMRLDRDDMIMPGIWAETTLVKVPHNHIPVGSSITAFARRRLYEFMQQSLDEYQWVHYCDTDGFSTTGGTFETSDKLGDLKLEKMAIMEGDYLQPKAYRMKYKELGGNGGGLVNGVTIKAKGFSLHGHSEPAIYRFERISQGFDIEVERMARIREQFSRKVVKPAEVLVTKRLQKQSPKRCFQECGNDSRPWTMGELEAFAKAGKGKNEG